MHSTQRQLLLHRCLGARQPADRDVLPSLQYAVGLEMQRQLRLPAHHGGAVVDTHTHMSLSHGSDMHAMGHKVLTLCLCKTVILLFGTLSARIRVKSRRHALKEAYYLLPI